MHGRPPEAALFPYWTLSESGQASTRRTLSPRRRERKLPHCEPATTSATMVRRPHMSVSTAPAESTVPAHSTSSPRTTSRRLLPGSNLAARGSSSALAVQLWSRPSSSVRKNRRSPTAPCVVSSIEEGWASARPLIGVGGIRTTPSAAGRHAPPPPPPRRWAPRIGQQGPTRDNPEDARGGSVHSVDRVVSILHVLDRLGAAGLVPRHGPTVSAERRTPHSSHRTIQAIGQRR